MIYASQVTQFYKVLLALSLSILSSLNTHAMDGKNEAAKIISETYIKEQLKYRMSDYLNKNPEKLGSTNPEIGTESAKFLGKILTAYSLINAKGDKERAVSAFYFVYSPEPTTAVIILCAQIVDMMVSLSHNRDLAKIYENVASLNRQTFNIYTQIYNVETDRQVRIINSIRSNLQGISEKSKLFYASKTFGYLSSEIVVDHPTDEDLIKDFENYASIIDDLNKLRIQKIFFDKAVDASLKAQFYEKYNFDLGSLINKFLGVGESLYQIEEIIQSALISYSGMKWRESLLEEARKNKKRLKSYYLCIDEMNDFLQESYRHQRDLRVSDTMSIRDIMSSECNKIKDGDLLI